MRNLFQTTLGLGLARVSRDNPQRVILGVVQEIHRTPVGAGNEVAVDVDGGLD